jgi:hypothetical protein
MLDRVRGALFQAITETHGDSVTAVRVTKGLARGLNAVLGEPLASHDELARRAAARERLAQLLDRRGAPAPSTPRAAAPVFVYHEKDRNGRELARIEELLGAKGFGHTRLDVGGDEAMLDFILRTAGCERDDLPVVFVADRCVGGYRALVEADVAGDLAGWVRGVRGG